MLGIQFNNKHSWKDIGLTIKSKKIGFPSPNIITDSVPFLNGIYDFSKIYGEISYGERVLKYVFNIIGFDKIDMNFLKIKVANWLKTAENKILKDDSIVGYYFLGKVTNLDFVEKNSIGEIEVEFTCYPFKFRDELEGDLTWDNFNFELDVLQQVEFDIKDGREVILYNFSSRKIYPRIITDSDFELIKGNTIYILYPQSEKFKFALEVGENKFYVIGNGTIKFEFSKEVL